MKQGKKSKRHVQKKARSCDYPECGNTECALKDLKKCSRCNAVYYCSVEHQKLHWKEHKKLCKEIVK